MKNKYIYIGIVFLIFGCKKEVGPQTLNPDIKGSGKLIVLNEGNFGFGNASVSLLNPETGEIANNQYREVNGVGIGDVLQSVTRHNNKFYFVVNNSGKVVVTDTNLKLITEITGFNSPRYIEFYGNKGFVSDLKQKAVYVVDVSTNQIINQIPTQGWTEDIIIYNNKLYVLDRGDYLTNSGPNFIFVINPISLIKEDSIQVGTNPNSMVLENNNLWVLSSGITNTDKAKLQRINLSNNLINLSYSFPNFADRPTRLALDADSQKLFFLNTHIYSINYRAFIINPIMFFQRTSQNFYGLNVINGIIYATDAKNYNQSGDLYRFSPESTIDGVNKTGTIPQSIN